LNNIVEQNHRFIKKRIAASLWFGSAEGAVQTVADYGGNVRWEIWYPEGRCTSPRRAGE
jgi:transposase-like protein